MVNLGLSDFLSTAPTGPQGLELAEEAIDDVIAKIDQEQAKLLPAKFAFAASIENASFGGADSAPGLALHYSRAHEVIWKTLSGVKEDLLAFQQACRDAKNEIVAADDSSAERMRIAQVAVETLASGSTSRRGQRDHREAQQGQDVTGGIEG